MVNGVLGDGFGWFHPLRKVVHMLPPREWATKLVGAVGACGQLSDHPYLPFRPPWQAICRAGFAPIFMPRLTANPILLFLIHLTQSALLQQIAYLRAENRILRSKISGNVRVTPAERTVLVRLGRCPEPARNRCH